MIAPPDHLTVRPNLSAGWVERLVRGSSLSGGRKRYPSIACRGGDGFRGAQRIPMQSACEAAGAAGTRRSPRPLSGGRFSNASGAWRREGEVVCGLAVIASAAKQSILSLRGKMDCFASLAMTAGKMDCFAEPVIGRAFARPGGSQ